MGGLAVGSHGRAAGAALIAALAFAAGCASGDAREERVELTRASELPAEYRALLEAYGQGGQAWQAARARALEQPEQTRFLVDNLVIEMVRAYSAMAGAGSRRGSPAFERAQSELVRLVPHSVPVLAEMLDLPDGVVSLLAMRTLERIGRPAVEEVTAILARPDRDARRRAAEVLANLPYASGGEAAVLEALGDRLANDPEWIVRAQAARTLGARGARGRDSETPRRALEGALADPDPTVLLSVAGALAVLDDPLAVPALIERLGQALQDSEVRQVRALQECLKSLTKETSGREWSGWREWWYEHRDALQQARRGT